MMRTLLLALALLLGAGAAQALPDLVLLVRHAEKSTEPGRDPGLSEAGQRRAEALAEALAHSGVKHVLVSAARRTQATAAPLARRLGLQAQVVGFDGGVAGHVAELSRQLQALQGTVLVVGHSNTLPELLQALGGPRWPHLCESSYGQAWVLRPGAPAQVLQLRYGAPDPAREGSDCL